LKPLTPQRVVSHKPQPPKPAFASRDRQLPSLQYTTVMSGLKYSLRCCSYNRWVSYCQMVV